MDMSIFAKVILAQLASVIVIVLILKAVLNRRLNDFAIRNLEVWNKDNVAQGISTVVVTSHKPLGRKDYERITSASKSLLGEGVKVENRVDRSIAGGIIIQFGKYKINFSLKDRLREAFAR